MSFEYLIDSEHDGMRVDRYLAAIALVASRSQLARRLEALTANGYPCKLSHRIRSGDRVSVTLSSEETSVLEPQDLPIAVIYEDDNVVVINKRQGMVVHPGAGNKSGTLANALLFHYAIEGRNVIRPGIVHRLDKETSGVIVAAKNVRTNEFLVSQFSERTTRKEYLAIAKGTVRPCSGRFAGPIGRDPANRIRFTTKTSHGKTAATEYRVVQQYPGYALLLLKPRTGRTHQLRVHLHDNGNPILGDPLYARKDSTFPDATLMLHAYSLSIRLDAESPARTFRAAVPQRFRDVLRVLRQKCASDSLRRK